MIGTTPNDVKAALGILRAVADAIRELGEVPQVINDDEQRGRERMKRSTARRPGSRCRTGRWHRRIRRQHFRDDDWLAHAE